MSTPTVSLLAGLVQGFTKAQAEHAHEELAGRAQSREAMMTYLGHLATNQNIPPEHQQWALGKLNELAQADVTKKLPKVDLSELPPTSLQRAPRQAVAPGQPGMTLKAPVPPGGATAAPPAGQVGRADDQTVNALGQAPTGAPAAGPAGSIGAVPGAPVPTLQLPPTPPTILQNPQPPMPISPGGALHVISPAERAQMALESQRDTMNRLQAQFPTHSPEDLAYFAQHGEFPKPQEFTLGPGQKRYSAEGKQIAENTEAKPGAKSGYTLKTGPDGPEGVIDNETGGQLTPEQVKSIPEAKAIWDRAQEQHQIKRGEKVEDEARALSNAIHKQETAAAIKGSNNAKAMVDLLDTQTDYINAVNSGKQQPTPRKDLALIVAAVRAMNPGTVRLPQKELELEIKAGSWGDRFRRFYDTATAGTLPDDQRKDLFSIVHDETTRTASSAAADYQQAFGAGHPVPPHLKRFTEGGRLKEPRKPEGAQGGGEKAYTPPAGAKRAVNPQNGHEIVVDNGRWVDAKTGEPIQ